MADRIIIVEISTQTLLLFIDDKLIRKFLISSSKYGIGNKENSFKTPLGKHIICEKMGKDSPVNGVLIGGKFSGEIAKNIIDAEDDLITTRAIRLRGLEAGINSGENIDSEKRGIWIHGTAQEKFIGTPASHGCIRMKNSDVIELFNLVKLGDIVEIMDHFVLE